MSERSSYAAGTPSWVDVQSPDTAQSAEFYGALFGWEAAFDPRADAGGYGLFTLGGKRVAGIGPQMSPGMPPFWSVYVTVADADASAEAAAGRGATVVAGPMDVLDAGRMAVLQDPVGSFVSIWQAGTTIGAEVVNEPGTFAWSELSTADLPAARTFYTEVFGWTTDAPGEPDAAAIFYLDGQVVCGAHAAGAGEFPAWSVWFSVEDCDAAAATGAVAGGTVIMPPNDMDFGRGAMLADPHGAVFGIGQLSEETLASAT